MTPENATSILYRAARLTLPSLEEILEAQAAAKVLYAFIARMRAVEKSVTEGEATDGDRGTGT